MKTIKIEIIDGKFGRVKWKGEKNYPHTPERVEVDGWKCIVEKNGDIFCEYVAFDGNGHYIFSYVLHSNGEDEAESKQDGELAYHIGKRPQGDLKKGVILLFMEDDFYGHTAMYESGKLC